MKVLPLVKKSPLTWKVVLKTGKVFTVKANSSFESDTRVYFTNLDGADMTSALHNGKIVSHVVAAFDQERVLYFAQEGTVELPERPQKPIRKKS